MNTLIRTIIPSYEGCYKIGEAITSLHNGLSSGTTWIYDTAANSSTVSAMDNGTTESFTAYAETDNVLIQEGI